MTPNCSNWKVTDSNVYDAHAAPVRNKKSVECLLDETYEKLAGTEANIYVFTTLRGLGLATNDVLSFAKKQTIHKRVLKHPDRKVILSAMKSKLQDALSFAKRLRQRRDSLRKKLQKEIGNNGNEFRRLQDKLVNKYRGVKANEMAKAIKKVDHIKEREQLSKTVRNAPVDTLEYLSGVNIFSTSQHDVRPEPPSKPFICDPQIKFHENELKLLARGPKFMVRERLKNDEFELDLEKSFAKNKYNNIFKESKDDCLSSRDTSESSLGPNERVHQTNNLSNETQGVVRENKVSDVRNNSELWVENSSNMVYNLKTKQFDLGNLRATKYKFNKEVFLPDPESTENEQLYELRRSEMRRIYNRACQSDNKPTVSHKSFNPETNLSKGEQLGLKVSNKGLRKGRSLSVIRIRPKSLQPLPHSNILSLALFTLEMTLRLSRRR